MPASYSWRICFMVVTICTHLSLIYQSCLVEILLSRSVSVPSCVASFKGNQILVYLKQFQHLETLKRISEMPLFEILTSLAIAQWFIFLAIFTIFISLEICTMMWKEREKEKKKKRIIIYIYIYIYISDLLWKNICILAVEHFSVLKHCILIGLCKVVENFYMAIFRDGLKFSLILNPNNKI